MSVSAERYHDISCGHRVYGHESKCAHLHGHNYRITFVCQAEDNSNGLDSIGRVIDFSDIKSRLCMWLEREWDHKFLVWRNDPLWRQLINLDYDGTVVVDFNPTAENMGQHLLLEIGPKALAGTGIILTQVKVEETRKCSATVTR